MIDKAELLRVLDLAVEAIGTGDALVWLITPDGVFNGRAPLDLLDQGDGELVTNYFETLDA